MPTFYRYLGGPRTFWGGGRTTIINNNIIGGHMPMMRAPHHHCCGGGGNMFQWMAGYSVANSFMSNLFGGGMGNFGGIGNFGMFGGLNNMFGMGSMQGLYPGNSNNYNYNNPYVNNMDLSAKVKSLEDELADAKQQIKDLQDSKCKCDGKDLTQSKTPTDEELAAANKKKNTSEKDAASNKKSDEVTNKDNKSNSDAVKKENSNEAVNKNNAKIDKNDEEFDNILDKLLKNSGFDNIEPQQKNYLKNNINEIYTDDNGNVRYNITAVAHDTDRVSTIASRFYEKGETPDLKVGRAKFSTQKSESHTITEPHSGDTIIANGVSEYGLKALMQEGKNGITKQGEITKTNKRISDLKSDFISGKNKLSKAYVLQNHLMSEAEYNKIINEKYKS